MAVRLIRRSVRLRQPAQRPSMTHRTGAYGRERQALARSSVVEAQRAAHGGDPVDIINPSVDDYLLTHCTPADDLLRQLAAETREAVLCVPKSSSTSCDQAVFVDQATDASLRSDAVVLKVGRFG